MMELIKSMMGGLEPEAQEDMNKAVNDMVMDSEPYKKMMRLLTNITIDVKYIREQLTPEEMGTEDDA